MSNKIDKIKHWYEKEGSVSPDDFKWLIDRTDLSFKQQDAITEYKRSEEVTVNQFRQAQEEIQRLRAEKKKIEKKFKKAIKEIRDIRDVAGKSTGAYLFAKNALVALEGDAE
ncbi:hypothetical protein [Bacillus atrophaeus]|uniref:hypothetical protein n=1 Tax=Bacillus atrophaeus TaxID=1452 RepID=UPI00077AADB5|nr:hypothetical protein [Bacillus atrophaeus]KXZ12945.1 hypothetical protein AXI57_17215 [Bacillus atrophaeus]MED4809559.1 VWA domain-containing protein [Bacillus atrophaeus]GED04344.1 hypothetical protein BAT02nite_39880 [Bacillus atrophaeus]